MVRVILIWFLYRRGCVFIVLLGLLWVFDFWIFNVLFVSLCSVVGCLCFLVVSCFVLTSIWWFLLA